MSFGVPYYQDSQYVDVYDNDGGLYTLISSTTPYTILSFSVIDQNTMSLSGDDPQIFCGDTALLPNMGGFQYSLNGNNPFSFSSDIPIHCSSDLTLSTADFSNGQIYAVVQYVPYDTLIMATSSSGAGLSTTTPFYTQDSGNISLELAILIVGMFLMIIGFFYNSITSKKPWL